MNIYSTLPEQITGKLLALLGEEYKTCQNSDQADIVILIRKSRFGGVESPAPHIKNPQATIIIAGTPDPSGEKFAAEAVNVRVPEENIYFLPKGQSLSLKLLTDKIVEISASLKSVSSVESDEEWVPAFDDDIPNMSLPKQERRKITRTIAFLSYKGGVGRTTLATSLLAHYQDTGERSCLLDLSWPSTAGYHIGVSSHEEKDNFMFYRTPYGNLVKPKMPIYTIGVLPITELISVLRKEYRRVLIDLPTYPPAELVKAMRIEKTVVLVNHDIVQVVEPTANKLKDRANHIFVYNRVIPEVEPEMVSAYLDNIQVEIIPSDIDGCTSALAAGKPAHQASKEIARVIGTLAAIIDKGGAD